MKLHGKIASIIIIIVLLMNTILWWEFFTDIRVLPESWEGRHSFAFLLCQLNFIISTLFTIIISTTYHTLYMRNKIWCDPEVLKHLYPFLYIKMLFLDNAVSQSNTNYLLARFLFIDSTKCSWNEVWKSVLSVWIILKAFK